MKRIAITAALAALAPITMASAQTGTTQAQDADEPGAPVAVDAPPVVTRSQPTATTRVPPPVPEEAEAAPEPEPATPAPAVREPVVTAEPLPTEPVNPYANSYNELLPLEPDGAEEENADGGFDDWGLLGLLGLLGLFGLKRRDRVVYAERMERYDDRVDRRG